MPIIRGDTSLGVHVRALNEALTTMIEDLPDVPSERRVRLRNLRAALQRAYSAHLPSETDLAHELAEEDGHGLPKDV